MYRFLIVAISSTLFAVVASNLSDLNEFGDYDMGFKVAGQLMNIGAT